MIGHMSFKMCCSLLCFSAMVIPFASLKSVDLECTLSDGEANEGIDYTDQLLVVASSNDLNESQDGQEESQDDKSDPQADVLNDASKAVPSVGTSEQTLFQKKESQQTQNCSSQVHTMRVGVRHIEGGGIGYNKGYTTIEGFFAPGRETSLIMPFVDLRGHVFDDGKMAANAGTGLRKMWGERIYGINSYYDYRNTHRRHYNQVSLGLETLGSRWDFRINGYLPVGKKMSSAYRSRFNHFSGHSMYISSRYEFAMKGLDAEAGIHFGHTRNFDFYAAAGPYYFIGELGNHAWGGKARLSFSFKDYITIEVSDSYDQVFKNNFQGQITFSYPFGPKLKSKKQGRSCSFARSLEHRMVQPVGREEIVVVNRHRKNSVAIDPNTGKPYVFWFVNNLSSSSGTFESPFSTLMAAQLASSPSDVIYVYPGDGTTTGLATITLQDQQKLLGTGITQRLATTFGTISVPAHSATLPLIGGGLAGSYIVCANGNEISGIASTIPAGAIGSTRIVNSVGVTDALIQNNVFTMNIATSVELTNCDGSIIVRNNAFNYDSLGVNSASGVVISSSIDTQGEFLIANNVFTGQNFVESCAIEWGQIQSFRNITITNNLFSRIAGAGGTKSVISGFFGTDGFYGEGTVTLSNNTVSQCGSSGSSARGIFAIPVQSGTLVVNLTNNVWTDTQGPFPAFTMSHSGAAVSQVNISHNVADFFANQTVAMCPGGVTLYGAYILNVFSTNPANFSAMIGGGNVGQFVMSNVNLISD